MAKWTCRAPPAPIDVRMQSIGIRVGASRINTWPLATKEIDRVRLTRIHGQHVRTHRVRTGLGEAHRGYVAAQIDHLRRCLSRLVAALEIFAVIDVHRSTEGLAKELDWSMAHTSYAFWATAGAAPMMSVPTQIPMSLARAFMVYLAGESGSMP